MIVIYLSDDDGLELKAAIHESLRYRRRTKKNGNLIEIATVIDDQLLESQKKLQMDRVARIRPCE